MRHGPINLKLTLKKVMDSADDISYADLIAFDDNGKTRKVSHVTDVGKYLAYEGNVNGVNWRTLFSLNAEGG